MPTGGRGGFAAAAVLTRLQLRSIAKLGGTTQLGVACDADWRPGRLCRRGRLDPAPRLESSAEPCKSAPPRPFREAFRVVGLQHRRHTFGVIQASDVGADKRRNRHETQSIGLAAGETVTGPLERCRWGRLVLRSRVPRNLACLSLGSAEAKLVVGPLSLLQLHVSQVQAAERRASRR